jgi:dTDP-L-rhamnose 4-epimerase
MARILVTGGAGFVGSHLVEALLAGGHTVRVIDSLVPQVHGPGARPRYLPPDVEFIHADIRDQAALERALARVEVIFHQAAEVGVGQSMYEIERYVGANTYATAVLLQRLSRGGHRVEKLIIASSMSIYGEGAYRCAEHGPVFPAQRSLQQLADRQWEMCCPTCGHPVQPEPTDEAKPLRPASVYAISKLDQELMGLALGRAYGLPTVALRYFNIYGRRQSLSNPYTGIAAIFGSRLLNRRPPLIFEDGRQTRDFTHVSDVVHANLLAMERDAANFEAINVGTGRPLTVLEVATTLGRLLGVEVEPELSGAFRAGDIRHCYADIGKARRLLGYEPRISFEDGMADLVGWMREQEATDGFEQARRELELRGLAR